MKRWAIAAPAVLIGLLVIAAPAVATFPGHNGKIAFESDRDGNVEIYTMNPDGAGQTRITHDARYSDRTPAWSPDGTQLVIACFDATEFCLRDADGSGSGTFFGHGFDILHPSWSPDGTRIAFDETLEYCDEFQECWVSSEIAVVNRDGTGHELLTPNSGDPKFEPSWSPDGSKIVYATYDYLYLLDPVTRSRTRLPVLGGSDPSWSPDGTRIAYSRNSVVNAVNMDVYVANADGSSETRLTSGPVYDVNPVWSPDGSKIAFASNEGGDYEIFVMNTDGSGRQALTDNSAFDSQPDWQTIPIRSYIRPQWAGLVQASLVPAYLPCASANRTHGPPLAFDSCAPPQRATTQLTFGTQAVNGQPAQSIGSVRLKTVRGDPTTPADEADVGIALDITDVRVAADLSDYTGQLEVRLGLRITDRLGGAAVTVQDTTLSANAQCAETADSAIGGRCTLSTTADAVVPGSVPEGVRTVWALDAVRVFHGSTPFAVQGVFVP